ncbi:MAG: deoxyribonuclease IV [Phycisphaerales bacterium]|nr:deoxyribonuclease IV [Phycisphaerales bacterium]
MFGSHLSIAGGLVNALIEARRLKMDTVQVFTKNQQQWRIPPLDDHVRDAWLAELARLGWEDRTVAHNSYLINLASPDDLLWEKSIAMMRAEIERCEALRIPHLVSHPGAFTTSDLDAGISRIIAAYDRVHADLPGYRTVVCLENTAGAGTTIGRTFEELARIREGVGDPRRLAYCLDTCHAFAGGYDVSTTAGVQEVLDEFGRICGPSHLRVVHVNDSKGGLGSRRDRHEHIGDGQIGKEGFAALVNRRELANVPKILETPKGATPKGTPMDTVNLRRLRRLVSREGKD